MFSLNFIGQVLLPPWFGWVFLLMMNTYILNWSMSLIRSTGIARTARKPGGFSNEVHTLESSKLSAVFCKFLSTVWLNYWLRLLLHIVSKQHSLWSVKFCSQKPCLLLEPGKPLLFLSPMLNPIPLKFRKKPFKPYFQSQRSVLKTEACFQKPVKQFLTSWTSLNLPLLTSKPSRYPFSSTSPWTLISKNLWQIWRPFIISTP